MATPVPVKPTDNNQGAKLHSKLQTFLQEMLEFGSVKGFKYFATYIRGKEEIIISVTNSPMIPSNNSFPELEVLKLAYEERSAQLQSANIAAANASGNTSENTFESCDQLSNSGGGSGWNLPYDKRTLMLSLRTQRQLSGVESDQVALPPASPSDNETRTSDENSTLFLLAGYSRYHAPYVWLRSNHDRLISLSKEENHNRDWPLNLRTTNAWRQQQVISPWHVAAEVIKLSTTPSPLNPFEIDLDHFHNLTPGAAVYATAAMINILSRIISPSPEKLMYASKVLDDIQYLTKLHFDTILRLRREGVVSQ